MSEVPAAAVEAANEAFWNAAGIRPPLALEAALAAAVPLIRQAIADEIADDIEHEAPDLPFVWSPARAASHCAEIARRVGGGGGGGQ